MKITPQDIIDKEFKVKFRGFDMAEVDAFLNEVAEIFFKLSEENTLLNERIAALEEKRASATKAKGRARMELPPELGNFLKKLNQDTAAINVGLESLKQDRSDLVSLEKNMQEIIESLKHAETTEPQAPLELPAELSGTLQELKTGSEAMATELLTLKESLQSFESLKIGLADIAAAVKEPEPELAAQEDTSAELQETLEELRQRIEAIGTEMTAVKEDRQTFESLKKSLENIVSVIKEGEPSSAPHALGASVELKETLEELRQKTETIGAEMAAFKEEIGSIRLASEETQGELLDQLKSYFDKFEEKLSTAAPAALPAGEIPKPGAAAIVGDELPEDTRVPEDEEQGGLDDDEEELEFLSENDILDVEKLRGIFQSVLDVATDAPSTHEDDEDTSSELLFFDDSYVDEEDEPEVSFSLDEKDVDKEQEKAGNA
ncbi:MAG: DivIVA domain-containing protein [Deltaproteobacteria bacterium]|jgi:DivIVA domain-containing protein|nr:DivIVA domain-containing protein [Deltaproteobacteria bacterium]